MANIKREQTITTQLLRELIPAVLARQTRPVPASEIAQAPEISSLNLSEPAKDTSNALTGMYRNRKYPHLKRVFQPQPGRSTKWGWFDARAVTDVAEVAKTKPAAKAPPRVEPEFKFDPVELTAPATTPAAPVVSLPPGVRSITIQTGGVSIHINLTS